MRDDRTPHSHFTWLPHPLRARTKRPRRAESLLLAPARRIHIYSFTGAAQSGCRPGKQPPNVMLNDVYNRRILELAGNIPRLGRLSDADATATAHSKLCGSTVTVDLKMDGDTVTDFAHEVKACALGQASSSIMARHVIGAKADELRSLRETVRRCSRRTARRPAANGPTSRCSSRCATTRRATPRPC